MELVGKNFVSNYPCPEVETAFLSLFFKSLSFRESIYRYDSAND